MPAGTEAVETSMRIRSRVKSQFQLAVGLSRRIPRLCELAEVQGEKPSPASEHPRTRWASHFLEQRLDPSRGRLRHLKKKSSFLRCDTILSGEKRMNQAGDSLDSNLHSAFLSLFPTPQETRSQRGLFYIKMFIGV